MTWRPNRVRALASACFFLDMTTILNPFGDRVSLRGFTAYLCFVLQVFLSVSCCQE